MPLSEHEQRILAELEESLEQHDPQFAHRVRSETVYRHAGRHCVWWAVCFIAGLAVVLAVFRTSVVLGLFGVAIMFASAVMFERNLRNFGRAGWRDFHRAFRQDRSGTADATSHTPRQWLRSRFRRDS